MYQEIQPARGPAVPASIVVLWFLRLVNGNQFYFKDQDRIRPDDFSRSPRAVREVRRDKELPFVAFLHELQRLGPAGNNAIHLKSRRLTPFVRAVELGPVDKRPAVIYRHRIGGFRRFPAAFFDDLIL